MRRSGIAMILVLACTCREDAVVGGAADALRVADFGASGDGNHDDGPAIQRALDRMHAGETLFFSPGRYAVNRGLVIRTPHVSLAGERAVIVAKTVSEPLFMPSAEGLSLRNLALEGTAVDASSSQYAVLTTVATPATGGTVSGCTFNGFNNGIKLDTASSGWTVHDSQFSSLIGASSGHGYGILVGNAYGTEVHDCVFHAAPGNGRHGVYLSGGASYGKVEDNRFEGFSSSAIAIYSHASQPACSDNYVARNIIVLQERGSNGSAGIEVAGHVTNTRVQANVIDSPGGVGIIITNAAEAGGNVGTMADGNRIVRPGETGIEVIGARDVTLRGNTIIDPNATGKRGEYYGIFVGDTSSPDVPVGNVFLDGNSVRSTSAANYRSAIRVLATAGATRQANNVTMPGLSEEQVPP